MSFEREMTCIVCPIGCRMTITEVDGELQVQGNQCPRGEKYAVEEVKNPTRIVPTTVRIAGGVLPRLPVKTAEPIPKDKIFDVMADVNQVTVEAPISVGDIIIENAAGTGVAIVATRSMPAK